MPDGTLSLELQVLGWAALLLFVQILLIIPAGTAQLGLPYLVSPRDEGRELNGVGGRLKRALENHAQTLPLYAAGAILLAFAGLSTPLTQACAWIYIAARVAYVPVYASGIPWLRTLVWLAATLAAVLMLLVALF